MVSAASTPSMAPGKTMSISTRSGRVLATCAMASSPVAAIPATSYPRSASWVATSLATMASSSTTSTLALAIELIPFFVCPFRECHSEGGPIPVQYVNHSPELACQQVHQLQAERPSCLALGPWQPDAVISDRQDVAPILAAPQLDPNLALVSRGKSMLQRVRDKFIDDQAT